MVMLNIYQFITETMRGYKIIWAMSWENLFSPHANNKNADQPAHPRSLISTFVVHYLDSIIPILAKCKISRLAGLCSWAGQFESYVVRKPRRQVFSWCGSSDFRKTIHRKFCTGGASGGAEADITTVPLSKAPPGFPAPKYASLDKEQHETRVTTLENGLRVASENKFGQFCTVGGRWMSRADYHAKYWLSWYYHYRRNPYHDTITIRETPTTILLL